MVFFSGRGPASQMRNTVCATQTLAVLRSDAFIFKSFVLHGDFAMTGEPQIYTSIVAHYLILDFDFF